MTDRLKQCFLRVLGPWPEPQEAEYGAGRWDSIMHMELVAEIELEFDIMMSTDEIIDLSSWAKAVEMLGKHLEG